MTRIGLISDTHSFLDEKVFTCFNECDEIWHAGDFGSRDLADKLRTFKPLKGVYGNIDGPDIRADFSEQAVFFCEGVKVMIRHIGGYPPKYNEATKQEIARNKPALFIAGHSHILKIMYDPQNGCLYMNPGAAGKQGWQKVRTVVRFSIHRHDISACEVIELVG